ncbi:hypothetical protein HYV83_06005 [Candidatus Woesearchaeota archaeon]|nr:hypothetical protein [Candidatus Woesearchaeota archaeon]
MNMLQIRDFNLKATLESGQLFRYHGSGDDFYYVVAGDAIIKIRQNRNGSGVEYGCSSDSFDVKKFLGLNHSYGKIIKSISRDEKIAAAIRNHYGLRVLEQEPWECTASFICSAFSNIPRIKQCIEKVAMAFGSSIEFDGFTTFSFPQPQQINDFAKLKMCGLGYRAKYLFETARIFSNNSEYYSLQHNSAASGMCNRTLSDLHLRKLSYEEAKKRVIELPGVGSKVADCILLFSCGFYEAFPVDVWIHRAMSRMYGSELREFAAERGLKAKKTGEKLIGDYARLRFGKYCGYAQQFLFHHARSGEKKPSPAHLP